MMQVQLSIFSLSVWCILNLSGTKYRRKDSEIILIEIV